MSVKQFPEPGKPKSFPFGTSGSFTYGESLDAGVYQVDLIGDDNAAASAYGLAVKSGEGYVVPVALDNGEGVAVLPFNTNNGINSSSIISTPNIAEFNKVRYEQGDPPSNLSVSFASDYSGSYVANMTVPVGSGEVFAYYTNGQRDSLGTTFPASVANPKLNVEDAIDSGVVNLGVTYNDSRGIPSRGLSTSVSFPAPPGAYATGGTIYTSGGYRYHKFTANGNLGVIKSGSIEYVVVAGGGGGGNAARNNGVVGSGGGGAGGFLSGSLSVSASTIPITVGAGGGAAGAGSNSLLGGGVIASGGGSGATSPGNGGSGGSGGGGGSPAGTGGSGTPGQGFAGGSSNSNYGGGGGGAGEAGNTDGQSTGGDGKNSASAWATATSSGVSGFFAGGGGGAAQSGPLAAGGDGGGGVGASPASPVSNGTVNTGGGGGGEDAISPTSPTTPPGGTGGSGIVLIRYQV